MTLVVRVAANPQLGWCVLRLGHPNETMLKFVANPVPGLAADAVSRLEAKLKISLPDDYRTFIQKHNGGEPYPGWILVNPRAPIGVERFRSFCDSPEYLMAVKHFSTMGHAGVFLPIADCADSGYLLRCGAGMEGVYFFDGHADEFEDAFRREASGFSELLNLLAYLPEELPWLDYLVTKDYENLKSWLAEFDPLTRFELSWQPIERATVLRDAWAVELMLGHGHDGATALGLAEGLGFEEIEDLLRAHLKNKQAWAGAPATASPKRKSWWQFWK